MANASLPGVDDAQLQRKRQGATGIVPPTVPGAPPVAPQLGSVVNGVRTFSDGGGTLGGAGSVPRTVSDAQVAGLAGGNQSVSGQNFGTPGQNGNTPAIANPAFAAGAALRNTISPPFTDAVNNGQQFAGQVAGVAKNAAATARSVGTGVGGFIQGLTGIPDAPAQPTVQQPVAGVAPSTAVQAPIPLPNFSQVQSGASTQPNGATSPVTGKPLSYGENQMGPDGKMIPVFNDKTVSQAQINDLSSRVNSAPDENIAHPGIGTATSEASGGAFTPTYGQIVSPTANPNAAANDGQADVEQAQKYADSDIGSILNEDPRSALGIASRNARLKLGDIRAPRSRSGAGGQSPYQEALGSLIARASEPVRNAQQSAITAATQAGDTTRAQIAADTARFDTSIKRPTPAITSAEDGTAHIVDPVSGVARPVLGTDGKPFKPYQTKVPEDASAVQKSINETRNALMGADETGQIPDTANPGKTRAPTEQELATATDAARRITAGKGSQAAAPPSNASDYIAALRKAGSKLSDADLTKAYKERYGS